MGHEIRQYMTDVDGNGSMGGGTIVEMDETFIGGKPRYGFYPVSTDGYKKVDNSKSFFATRRRIRGL
jgi:hypothetical protein